MLPGITRDPMCSRSKRNQNKSRTYLPGFSSRSLPAAFPIRRQSHRVCRQIPVALSGAVSPHSNVWKSRVSLAASPVEEVFNHSRIYLARLVVDGFATSIQNEHMRDVALVVQLDQLLLFRRALNVKIDDHKMHPGAVLVVQFNRPACLPL